MNSRPGTALVPLRVKGEIALNPEPLSDDRLAADGFRASGC